MKERRERKKGRFHGGTGLKVCPVSTGRVETFQRGTAEMEHRREGGGSIAFSHR